MYADDVKIYFSYKHQSHSSLQQEGMYAFSSVQSSRFCYTQRRIIYWFMNTDTIRYGITAVSHNFESSVKNSLQMVFR